MIPQGFQKIELSIEFQRIAGNKKDIDFVDFCMLMHRIYEEKVTKYCGQIGLEGFIGGLDVTSLQKSSSVSSEPSPSQVQKQ